MTKYIIYAKILGNFLPENIFIIGNCTIKKDLNATDTELDIPEIPVRMKSTEFHILEKGVRNFVIQPRNPISVRNFNSDYIITTEVSESNIYHALSEANDRFLDAVSALTLAIKNTTYRVGKKRFRRSDQIYDFEIVSVYIRNGRKLERVKLPAPLSGGHNYFPKPPSAKFSAVARKYYNYQEPIFRKAMIYLQRSLMMRKYGLFGSIDVSLNLIKAIELIARNIDKTNHFGLNKSEYKNLKTKELFVLAGKLLKVRQKSITNAKKAWDERNKKDISHQTENYNPYHRSSGDLIDWISLEESTADYLIKYYEYINKVSMYNYHHNFKKYPFRR